MPQANQEKLFSETAQGYGYDEAKPIKLHLLQMSDPSICLPEQVPGAPAGRVGHVG